MIHDHAASSSSSRRDGPLLSAFDPADRMEILVHHADGTVERAVMPTETALAVDRVIRGMQVGAKVVVLDEAAELTPNEAAAILGMSRPLVIRRMDAGDLPFRYVGAHRRCRVTDVLALKAREDQRRQAIEALKSDTDDLRDRYGL